MTNLNTTKAKLYERTRNNELLILGLLKRIKALEYAYRDIVPRGRPGLVKRPVLRTNR